MRLQALYFIGALAVAATPLSAGAQSLPANHQWTANAQADNQAVQRCPPSIKDPAVGGEGALNRKASLPKAVSPNI
jgi:hypothetical protein